MPTLAVDYSASTTHKSDTGRLSDCIVLGSPVSRYKPVFIVRQYNTSTRSQVENVVKSSCHLCLVLEAFNSPKSRKSVNNPNCCLICIQRLEIQLTSLLGSDCCTSACVCSVVSGKIEPDIRRLDRERQTSR